MDFLLIVIAIGGFVTAIVMLVLASRANRLQNESDERVDTLQAMATGSVLFAHASASEPVFEPSLPEPATLPLFAQPAPLPEPALHSARGTVLEPGPPPVSQPAFADDLDLALSEFADEDDVTSGDSAGSEESPMVTRAPFGVTASAYPFVMTVPAAAGAGRVQISFDRSRSRSRP
jgi:hypothetical protein